MEEGPGIIIPSFNTYLLSTHHVPDAVWKAGIGIVSKLDPCPHQASPLLKDKQSLKK